MKRSQERGSNVPIRKAKQGGKTAYLDHVSVWWNEDDNRIHMRLPGRNPTTVNSNVTSIRGHPHLFKKLARCLADAGVPHPPVQD